MKVEIWSDIVCPWCYIGKRRFEKALQKFESKDKIEVEYKSFQLAPDSITDPLSSTIKYLIEKYRIDENKALQMVENVTAIAAEEGLSYDLENAVVCNTLRAHRLLHFAKSKQLQIQMKERLMRAYFSERKNVDDVSTLIKLASEVGLDKLITQQILDSDQYTEEVENDIYQARTYGITGVPFFVLNNKYGISGAQPTEVFLNALRKSFDETVSH